ncbi:MAG: type II secretion system major pseudopilin GspG [Rhodospirillales bacterium]
MTETKLHMLQVRTRVLMSSAGSRPGYSLAIHPRATSATAGFTLLEILVVLVILGLLAAVVAGPQVFRQLGAAKSEAAKLQLDRVGGSLDLFRLDVGRYPAQQEGLRALVEPPVGVARWNGPYLKKQESLIDPWGRPFGYRYPGQHGEYDLWSLGADGTEGGDGENRDVVNW